jgi:hypothetical protein
MLRIFRNIAGKPGRYFVFLTLAAALFGTSLIQVPCPVCDGTGVISHSVGMENVRIASLESRVISSKQDACTGYIVTKAAPIINLTNTGSIKASGYLYLHLIDLSTGQTLISQHLAVEANPNALTVVESQIGFYYGTVESLPDSMDILAETVINDVPCIACEGKSKVGASSYLLTKSYKDTFISKVRSSSEYGLEDWIVVGGQRVIVGSKEFLDWMELN